MLSVVTVVKKLQPAMVASQWKILSAIPRKFSSGTGYTPEEIEKFRKTFRTMSSYEESISTQELIPYLQSINFIKPMETYQQYIAYGDRLFGGRYELTQMLKYIEGAHDSRRIIELLLNDFDMDNAGLISIEEFEFVMKTVQLNDPKLRKIPYEKFVIEAGKNGRISASKCEKWVKKELCAVE